MFGKTINSFLNYARAHSAKSFVALVIMLTFVSGIIPAPTDATSNAVVSVYVDGEKQVVSTAAETVGDVLSRAGIAVEPGDIIEPALNEPIASQVFNINIYRARDVMVVDGSNKVRVKSAYQGPRLIVEKSTDIKVYPEDEFQTDIVQDFITDNHIGLKITIDRAMPIKLTQGGKTLTLRTQAETVEELLKDKEIAFSSQDKLNRPINSKLSENMEIVLVRVGRETISEEKAVRRPVETILDNDQPIGYERVRDEGKDGVASVTYEVVYHDGKEVKRKQLSRVVTVQPRAKVLIKGNKVDSYSSNTEKLLYDLRMCETGGRYTADTGNGYYGAYQFMKATWDSLNTGYDYPYQAPPAVQDKAVLDNVRRSAGGFWSQHPGCSQKLGLPKYP